MDILTAIQRESLARIKDIVHEKGFSCDGTWLDYEALNTAIQCKRKDVVKWLITIFCRVNKDNKADVCSNTPLHNAVKLGDIEIVQMLLQNGASITAVNSDDDSPLHLSFLYRYDKITDLLLEHLIKIGNQAIVTNSQGITHLHIASARNNVEAIKSFIEAGAKINDSVKSDSLSSYAGYTALHFAIEFRSLEAAKFLLASGCKMGYESNILEYSPVQMLHEYRDEYLIMLDHLDPSDFSYFHVACLRESASMVEKFIDKGADLNEPVKQESSLCYRYTPLQCAIASAYDRKEKVQLLLSHGANVQNEERLSKNNQMTALHLAFYNEFGLSDAEDSVIDDLYKIVKNTEKNIMDQNQLSHFHIAVAMNDFVMVNIYLDKGVDVNQAVLQNNRGFSGYTALHFAVIQQLIDMTNFLIEHGANVNATGDDNSQTPLFIAFQLENVSLIELLFNAGARLKEYSFDISNNTLLHYAVEAGSPEIVQHLVNSGSQVNVKNIVGETPLIKSVQIDFPNKEVIQILLKAGANMKAEDNFGNTALTIINTSVWLSKDIERFMIYKMFLENANDFDDFELIESSGTEKIIKTLLSIGFDLSLGDPATSSTLVHQISKNADPAVIRQLRGQKFDINMQDKIGYTPLMYAVYSGRAQNVKFLLEEGADIEATEESSDGRTALYIAEEQFVIERANFRDEFYQDFRSTIQILLEHGANVQIEINDELKPTIFDVLSTNDVTQYQPVLAHLALQKMNGTFIKKLIQDKIDANDTFKACFENCEQKLLIAIYQTVKLSDILLASERRLQRYVRNKELLSKLKDFQTTVEYFDMIMDKRVLKAIAMVELRKTAASIVCTLMKSDYNRFPCIADEVVSYLKKEDLKSVVLI